VNSFDPQLTITARGPAADGRLPLAEMARLCGEFQATLERIALVLHGTTSITGRRPREVVDAVRVEFTGFAQGSAVLELELPATADGGALLEESLAVLVAGADAVRTGRSLPEAFTPQVLDGLIRFVGGLEPGTVTELVIGRGGRPLVVADSEFRGRLRETRRKVWHAETTIVGLLQMGDFAPSALRCRIDTVHASVACTFDETLAETVLGSLNRLVVASGTGQFTAGGATLRSLDLSRLEPLPRAPEASLDELTHSQQVTPWATSPTGTGFGTDGLSDADFEAFLSEAMSARGAE
jgi:hypothetical protein